MTTIPNGAPAWVRSNDYTVYGGHLNKRNYQDEPVVNPKTDVGADAIQRMSADLAAVARMAPFCVIAFTADSSNSSISVTDCRMMTGVLTSAYSGSSPPTGFPLVTHVSSSVYSIIIGGTYGDEYSVDGTFSPQYTIANCTSGPYATYSYPIDSTRVFVYSSTGTGSYCVQVS